MIWLKRVVIAILVILVFFWGVIFSIENTQQMPLNLVFVELPDARVSIWIVSSFIAGGLLGVIFSLILITQLKTRVIRLKRKLEQAARPESGKGTLTG